MATTYYKAFHSTVEAAILDILEWLTDGVAAGSATGTGGPSWAVIEARDGAGNVDTPSGGTGVSDLPGGNGWNPGTASLTAGAWIVLESLDNLNTNHFQLYIEFDSTSALRFRLIPLEDFATGGGDVSPPVFPATAVPATDVLFDGLAAANTWYVVADEGTMVMVCDQGGVNQTRWIYAGELDQPRTPSGATWSDDRPYVIWDEPDEFTDPDGTNTINMNRLSPYDDATLLTLGRLEHLKLAGENRSSFLSGGAVQPDNGSGQDAAGPLGVVFTDGSHYHRAGFCRLISEGGSWLSNRGTMENDTLAVVSDFVGLDDTRLVLDWDGSTAVP